MVYPAPSLGGGGGGEHKWSGTSHIVVLYNCLPTAPYSKGQGKTNQGGGEYMSSASSAGDLPDLDMYYNLAMFVNNSREHVGMTPESVPLAWHTSVCENVVGTWPVM